MHHVPVAVALAGGYAVDLNDTVTIHANTARAAKEVLDRVAWKRP
jgi:acetoin utilization deacetylase AcuC-like enzyme